MEEQIQEDHSYDPRSGGLLQNNKAIITWTTFVVLIAVLSGSLSFIPVRTTVAFLLLRACQLLAFLAAGTIHARALDQSASTLHHKKTGNSWLNTLLLSVAIGAMLFALYYLKGRPIPLMIIGSISAFLLPFTLSQALEFYNSLYKKEQASGQAEAIDEEVKQHTSSEPTTIPEVVLQKEAESGAIKKHKEEERRKKEEIRQIEAQEKAARQNEEFEKQLKKQQEEARVKEETRLAEEKRQKEAREKDLRKQQEDERIRKEAKEKEARQKEEYQKELKKQQEEARLIEAARLAEETRQRNAREVERRKQQEEERLQKVAKQKEEYEQQEATRLREAARLAEETRQKEAREAERRKQQQEERLQKEAQEKAARQKEEYEKELKKQQEEARLIEAVRLAEEMRQKDAREKELKQQLEDEKLQKEARQKEEYEKELKKQQEENRLREEARLAEEKRQKETRKKELKKQQEDERLQKEARRKEEADNELKKRQEENRLKEERRKKDELTVIQEEAGQQTVSLTESEDTAAETAEFSERGKVNRENSKDKIWVYSELNTDQQSVIFLNSVVLYMQLAVKPSEDEEVFASSAPLEMKLGDFFNHFVHTKKRNRKPDIDMTNEEKDFYGWKFFTKGFLKFTMRELDPTASMQKNKLKEASIIIARRVAP